jgi:hypothetical protein
MLEMSDGSWVDWFPFVFFPAKIIVLGIGMSIGRRKIARPKGTERAPAVRRSSPHCVAG